MKSLSVLILVLVVNYVAGSAEQSTSYNFKLLDTHLPLQVAEEIFKNGNDKSIDDSPTYELFSLSKQGHQSEANASHADDNYLCEIHTKRDIELDKAHESVSESKEESQAAILQNAMTLIHESLPINACLYAFELNRKYWTYALCTGDKIIQYHEGAPVEKWGKEFFPEDPNEVFVLGRFSKALAKKFSFENQASEAQYQQYLRNAEKSVTLLDEKLLGHSRHVTQKAVSHIVTDGSVCDLTHQPRAVEVLYICDKNGGTEVAILDALEIKLCHYRMFVHVPRLCSYAPFIPDKPILDSAVDIQCQRMDESGDKVLPLLWDGEDVPQSPQEKFQKYAQNVVLRDHPLFPVRADNKIDVSDHFLAPMGRGFYMGRNQVELKTSSVYINMRNVVVFNGFYTSFNDLLTQFVKIFYQCMNKSLLAPSPSDTHPLVLSWSHSFIVWYEIYDYLGNFLGLARIVRDTSDKYHVLKAQLVDPVTLLDSDGDKPIMAKFERPEFDAPYDMWNFQYFSENGGPLPNKALQPPKESLEMIKTPKQKVGSIPIIAYNMGITANNQVLMQLVDIKTEKVLDGEYADDGNFKFFIDIAPGHRKEFTMKPMDPDQDFVGFTVDVGTEDVATEDVATLDSVNNSIEKHLLIDEDKIEENIRKDSVVDESLDVNDEFMEPEYTSGRENYNLPDHEQAGNSIQNQESDVSNSEMSFEDITAGNLGQLFAQELEHLIDEL